MKIKGMVCGESKNVEWKEMLPKNSEKYVKTVIAFANTQGGRLIIGVKDETREVVGIDSDSAFGIMDSIANAVADSCIPQIVPDIELRTMDGRTVIVVTVAPGPNRPYYLKAKGKENGTYIRVAGTSRPAYPEKIKELEMEGMHISWDELACIGYAATEEKVEKLCKDIMKYRKEAGLPKREMSYTQLMNWKILKAGEDSVMASNAFALLTSDYFSFSKTQCAVFKGKERSVFLDKKEFTGPIYEQIEDAIIFVLRNIRLEAKIEGMIRKECYELPIEAIREMIINAHCHRNLMDESCIQVAVYDDRLEVTSPGGLYNGLTYDEIMSGHSKLRNRAVARVFNQMGLIESWGTGIRRIVKAAENYGLPTPEIQVFDNMFRINLYRSQPSEIYGSIGETSEKYRRSIGEVSGKYRISKEETTEKYRNPMNWNLNDTQRKVVELLSENPQLSAVKLAGQIGITSRNIESNIKKLKEKGILIRHGSPKSGYWEILR